MQFVRSYILWVRLALTFLLLGFFLGTSNDVHANPRYKVVFLAGNYSVSAGINDSGQICGSAYFDEAATEDYPAVLTDSSVTFLNPYTSVYVGGGPDYGHPHGINSSGQVVGASFNATGGLAVLWTNLKPTLLNLLNNGVSANGLNVNRSGQSVGYCKMTDPTKGTSITHAVRWIGTAPVDLGTLPGDVTSEGYGINDSGQVAGYSESTSALHAVRWTGTTPTNLTGLGGTDSQAYGINASGQVAGQSQTKGNKTTHAVLWTGTTPTDLGTLGGAKSYAYCVNDSGDVVGASTPTGTTKLDLFFYTGGIMYDVNDLIPAGTGITDLSPVYGGAGNGLNNSGQIVANCVIGSNQYAVRLDPITEQAAISVLQNYAQGGTVAGGGTFTVTTPLKISATANLGWAFKCWDDGNTDNPRSIIVPSGGKTYTAIFRREPLVFIPGIAGSILSRNGSQVWPTIYGPTIRSLALSAAPTDVVASNIVRYSGPIDVYASFVQNLTGIGLYGGYTEFTLAGDPTNMTTHFQSRVGVTGGVPTLFPFPYDWRYGNANATSILHEYIANIRQLYGGSKVNIVAHSQGGLVARRYILDYGSADIDHCVTVASPFWGAPVAIKRLEDGDFYAFSPIDYFDNSAMLAALVTFPSIRELLPTTDYLQNGGSPVLAEDGYDFNGNRTNTETYSAGEFYAAMDPSGLNALFHSWKGGAQDNWSTDTGTIAFLHICGVQNVNSTPVKVTARACVVYDCNGVSHQEHHFDVNNGLGDGTVPLLSAERSSPFWAPGTQVRPISGDWEVAHVALMGNFTVHSMIDAFLSNQTVQPSVEMATKALGDVSVSSQHLTVSGVNYVHIVDSLGNDNAKISDVAANAIPGVTINYGGGEPWVDILADGTVDATIAGTASDPPIEICVTQLAADGTGVSLQRYRFNPAGHAWQGQILAANVSGAAAPVISVDKNNDGIFDPGEEIAPVLSSGTNSPDTTAPSLSMTLLKMGSEINVSLTATDDVSPSPRILYTLNGGPAQTYLGPISVPEGQNMVIGAFAEDEMGNTSGQITTNIQPVLSATKVAGGAVSISWPVAEAYILNQADSLTGQWSPASVPVTSDGVTETASVPITGVNQKFFRLQSQTVTK